MVNSVSSNAAQMQWQAVQATRSAQPSAPVTPVSPVSSVGADSVSSVKSRYDTVQISAEGQAYASAQAAASGSKPMDNATLLKELNTAGSSGLSYVQQQMASLKAGVSASALMGNFGAGSSKASSFTGNSALDVNSLLNSYTQSRQTNTILRNAGASALGSLGGPSGSSGSDSSGSDTAVGAEESTSSDLSKYSLGELSKLLSSGSITKEQYLAEGARRQQDTQATQSTSTVSAAVGAAAQ